VIPIAVRTAVLPSPGTTALQPLDQAGLRVDGGFWAERLATNRGRTIPHGLTQLETSGALGNLRNAARGTGLYVGGLDDAGVTFPFLDSDVYKWLEAVGWEQGREPDPDLAARAGEVIGLVAAAQRPDGYLGTFVQLSGRPPFGDLAWGHELYCVGHLIQAAVAWQRALGDERLLAVARRACDRIETELGADRREGIDGHPEIEMALVELFRLTGDERYVRFASLLLERRGRGLLGPGRYGARYWQDHLPVREAPTVAGHAVRQLYLDCGAVDVAVETRDHDLLTAVVRRWEDMWATRTYLTGALGSRHRDEAFGDPMELPPDRAYAETCAAIASVMLAWRLLLATGEARFADALERTFYNAVLPGVSLDGTHFFYVNPLLQREPEGRLASGDRAPATRAPWYPCACCPPNLMRTLSSFEQLLAARDGSGLLIAQYADARVTTEVEGSPVELRMTTDYPWAGRVDVAVERAPEVPWALRLRIPSWAGSASVQVGETTWPAARGSWSIIERAWRAGDRVRIDLDMRPRVTVPDERIDAIRACAALERGPLVYCLEGIDLPAGGRSDEVGLVSGTTVDEGPGPAGLPGVTALRVTGLIRDAAEPASVGWPYREVTDAVAGRAARAVELTAVPYFAWANRDPGPMRVWVPVAPPRRDRWGR
jgi:hypothetical protein